LPNYRERIYSWDNSQYAQKCPKHLIHGDTSFSGLNIVLRQKKLIDIGDILTGRSETILSLAPLTLLSRLLDIDNCRKYKIVIMGGAIENGIGNDSTYSEYNFMVDPTATNQIFLSGCYPIIVPLDVTRQITFGNELERILDPDLKTIFDLLKGRYLNLGQTQIPLHDLTAASFLVAPDAFTLRHRHAEVIETPLEYAGCLLLDQHMYSRKPSNCLIINKAEIPRIKYEVINQMAELKHE
jgi:purine nucleosidase